ncbi:MAG: response regulator transcription factor [Cytophagales bacterium]|nr:response regulator transcription factor [Cytophagales bacterium]
MIKLLLADDHKVLIEGIKSILTDVPGINVIADASNGREVLDKLKKCEVDVNLLNINMPVLDGVDTCKLVHKKYPEIKVLWLPRFK